MLGAFGSSSHPLKKCLEELFSPSEETKALREAAFACSSSLSGGQGRQTTRQWRQITNAPQGPEEEGYHALCSVGPHEGQGGKLPASTGLPCLWTEIECTVGRKGKGTPELPTSALTHY